MEGTYGVSYGNKPAGKVTVSRRGLYYSFSCRCKLPEGTVCRLYVSCGEKQEKLGVLVPVADGFGLDTQMPAKRLGRGTPEFALLSRQTTHGGTFVPIYPEEPFAYLTRLQDAYLQRQNGQLGILLK